MRTQILYCFLTCRHCATKIFIVLHIFTLILRLRHTQPPTCPPPPHSQLWALVDCLDKYNLSNGFVGLSHHRPTAPPTPHLLPLVPSWAWEVLRAGVVLGTLGVLLYLGLQQYSTRMLSQMATMGSPATAAAAAAAVGAGGGVAAGGVAASAAHVQQQGGLLASAVWMMVGRVWWGVWPVVRTWWQGVVKQENTSKQV